ncbi:MAG: toprim domain-containing protein [Burkholderiaceae bacterium]|nr:toprim domain-containing protein [Burkholderiaceae bacterium]
MDFRTALEAAGLRPRDIVADGRWRRCATDDKPARRNGAYCLNADGRGVWRNWATDSEVSTWTDGDSKRAAPVDPAVAERRRQQARSDRIAAIRRAREVLLSARPCRLLHPYLANKGLSALGTAGLAELDGWLVIPVMWRGRLISVQRIHPDGTKRFAPGAPVKGGHYAIKRQRAAVTVLCEGLATGLAVYQCVRNSEVIVCFDAGNILPVVQELRPSGNVIVAGDNDHGTQARRGFNPGIEKAKNAAELIGAGVVWPEGIEGSDVADMLKELGPTGAKRIERLILGASRYVPREAPA